MNAIDSVSISVRTSLVRTAVILIKRENRKKLFRSGETSGLIPLSLIHAILQCNAAD